MWAGEILRPTELQALLVWAAIIGVVGAVSAQLFREATDAFHLGLTGQPGNYVDSFAHIPWWKRILIPVFGGAMAGCALHFVSRVKKSETTADYMEAIVVGDGRVAFRASLMKSLGAFFSASSGASIGREGPLVQLAAVLASLPGRFLTLSLPKRRQLVACGAAAGIASAYNAPIGGAFFVAEIILGSLAMESFGPLVVSSVIATLVTRAISSSQAIYETHPFALHSNWEVAAFVVLGIGCGFVAPAYVRFLRACEKGFQWLPIPRIAKLALGGAIFGSLAILHPEVCGNGNSVVYSILHSPWAWRVLLAVLVLKVVATGVTFGSGAVGGVFTPTLLTGAAMGYLFGTALVAVFPHAALDPRAYALVGMGSFLAAATGAPIMAIIMLFELTLNYQIILPVMLASVLAYYTCRTFKTKFLYDAALERKGAAVVSEQLAHLAIVDIMRPNPVCLRISSTFEEIAETFLQHRFNYLYVVDDSGRFVGVVALHDVKAYLDKPELASVLIAEDIRHGEFPSVTREQSLEEALHVFEDVRAERLPVVESRTSPILVGSLSKTDILIHLLGRHHRR